MRKFVVKNRQKRKYIRKNEKDSLYSFSKTNYGILPILIMAVAFTATIIISAPFRNFFTSIRINLQFPQFSLINPLQFFQTVFFDFVQIGLACIQVLHTAWATILHTVSIMNTAAKQGITIFNPRPLFELLKISLLIVGDSLLYGISVIGHDVLITVEIMTKLLFFMLSFTLSNANFVSILIMHFLFFIWQFILNSAINSIQITIKFGVAATQFIAIACIDIFQILLQIITVAIKIISSAIVFVWMWLNSITTAIFQAINNAFTNVIHFIEIPFKILGAFFLEMKPYVDVLGDHMQMTGEDFTNGFTNIGKVASLMSSPK